MQRADRGYLPIFRFGPDPDTYYWSHIGDKIYFDLNELYEENDAVGHTEVFIPLLSENQFLQKNKIVRSGAI